VRFGIRRWESPKRAIFDVFPRIRNLTATLTANVFGRKHNNVGNYKWSSTLFQNFINFGLQTAKKEDPHFYHFYTHSVNATTLHVPSLPAFAPSVTEQNSTKLCEVLGSEMAWTVWSYLVDNNGDLWSL